MGTEAFEIRLHLAINELPVTFPPGDHFTDGYTREQMSTEVDSFIMRNYGSAAAHTVMFHYTDWSQRHVPLPNNTQYFVDHYNRAEV